MGERTLSQLKPGETARVKIIRSSGAILNRLLDMGIVRGAEIKVERVAPLGDPMVIKVRGYHLSLRKSEAADIVVEIGRAEE